MNLINNIKSQKMQLIDDNKIITTTNNSIKKHKKNIFFDELYNLMSDIKFKKFYNNYLDSWDNCQAMIMYFKLFKKIEKEYFKKFNKNISHKLMNIYLDKIMNDSILRHAVIESFNKYKETAHMKYLEFNYKNIIKNKKRLELDFTLKT